MIRSHLLLLSILAAGCGTSKEDTSENEDPMIHACEQVGIEGTTLMATSMAKDATAILAPSEDPYTVTLVAGAAGHARIEVDKEASYLLFAGTADVVMDLYHEEAQEGLPAASPNDGCPEEIPEHFDLDLHEPGTYHLELGPAVVDSVWLLLMDAAGHVHE